MLTLHSFRPPTSQALSHRARHHLQPYRISCNSRSRIRRYLQPSPTGKFQGRILQVQRDRKCRCRLGVFLRWKCRAIIWCGSFDQRHWDSELQRCCLFGELDLHGELRTKRQPPPIAMASFPPTDLPYSSFHKSSPRNVLLTRLPSVPSPAFSKPWASACSSLTGAHAPIHSTRSGLHEPQARDNLQDV